MFTVATISYNQSQFLEQCIQSVVDQLPEGSEYFVMDGGSTDGSVEIIEKYQSKISYWQSEPDGGPASALASAVERATQPYFLYINSDDFLIEGALAKYAQFISDDPGKDIYYGNGITLFEETGRVAIRYSDRWNAKRYAMGLCSVVQQSTVLSRESILAAGNFPKENKTCWDGELLWKIAQQGGAFRRVPAPLGVFRIHGESITGAGQNLDKYHEDRRRIAATENLEYLGYENQSPFRKLMLRLTDPINTVGRIVAAFTPPPKSLAKK